MSIETLLLITTDQSGQFIGPIQSGRFPVPRIIIVNSAEALGEAWENQKKKMIFYHSVLSIRTDEELDEAKEKLGIKDGTYFEASQTRLASLY